MTRHAEFQHTKDVGLVKYAISLVVILFLGLLVSYWINSKANADTSAATDSSPADELEKAQSEVQRTENLLRKLIDESVNGIVRFSWDKNAQGKKELRSIFVNKAGIQFLGRDADDLIGRAVPDIVRLVTTGMDSQEADDIVRRFEMAVNRNVALDVQVKQRNAGQDRWFRLIAEPVSADYAMTLVDITERKKEEELTFQGLKDRIRELEERNRELTERIRELESQR